MENNMANELSLVTGIHFTKEALKQLNAMTFIYDPTWNPEEFSMPTLPACFFHVKKMDEVMTSEISQKQMLFYDSGKKQGKQMVEGNVLNVVSDNIVIKPKMYKLDILVPFSNISTINASPMYNANNFIKVTESFTGAKGNTFTKVIIPYLNTWYEIVKDTMKGILNAQDNTDGTEWLKGFMSTPDYNKNALEAMWRGRKIVKMKLWNSWEYKYLAIVDLDITKEGTDDGMYEATLTVQEVPIMSYKDSTFKAYGTRKALNKNAYLQKKGSQIIKALDKMDNLSAVDSAVEKLSSI